MSLILESLDVSAEELANLALLLTPEEKKTADSYHTEKLRNRAMVRRALLKKHLAVEARTDPTSLRIKNSAYGKPYLESTPRIFFSVSHREDLAAYAISPLEVGIDIEKTDGKVTPELERLSLCEPERIWLDAQPASERARHFFRFWTAKEALLKARGTGLSFPMKELEIDVDSARVLRINGSEEEAAKWSLQLFVPAPGFQGALITQSPRN